MPHADRAARRHATDEMPGGVSAAGAVQRLLSHLRAPGLHRSGFPAEAPLSAAQRSAARNRVCSFLPEVPVAQIDQMLLLQEFERLLEDRQPERKWCLSERRVRERIPAALLAPAFLEASQLEGFLDTEYIPHRDCLLVALHHRALPGHVLWHSWMGDLLSMHADGGAAGPAGGPLCPVPSFNDWWHLVARGGSSGETTASAGPEGAAAPHGALPPWRPPPPSRFLADDARDVGYCRVVEKILVPSDGSVILRTTLQRGLRECLPRPHGGAHAGEDAGAMAEKAGQEDSMLPGTFAAPPRFASQLVRVVRGDVAFGIVSDAAWAAKAERLRKGREEREEAAARTAAAAASEGTGAEGDPAADVGPGEEGGGSGANDGVVTPEEPAPRAVTERRLEDLRFGGLWVAFRGGARCTARMHHERPWFLEGDLLYDTALVRPGVLVTFTPTSGCAVQALSDGSVRLVWPAAVARLGGRPSPVPGGAGDPEVARTVAPLGVLVRSLLSGRREVYHPDGTRAVRNPTLREVEEQCQRHRAGGGGPLLDLLERMAAAYAQTHGGEPSAGPPTMREKISGLPGHWRVTRPDGGRFGRVALARDAPAPEWLEQLGGVLVDGGEAAEYEIDPASVSALTDPHTGQSASSSPEGLLTVEEAGAATSVCLLPDGTRMVHSQRAEGYSVAIHLEGAAHVECLVNAKAPSPSMQIAVRCDDGTRLEMTPRQLNHKGELVPSDPSAASTNASVLLRRPDGVAVFSRGSGEVNIFAGMDSSVSGEADALRVVGERTGVYVAQLDGDLIHLRDSSGNAFEVRGEQSVGFRLAVSMGDDFPSPRCGAPGRPQGHPDAKYLPLPEEAPAPRLFAVSGSGDAEELLSEREAREALRLAGEDAEAVVLRGEPLGEPSAGCLCHSILLPAPPPAGSMGRGAASPPQLPPCIAGLRRGGAGAPQKPRPFTELRQFVEYPPVGDCQRRALLEAQARLAGWDGERRASAAPFGQGPQPKRPGVLQTSRELAGGGA
uniref:Uncharacterized protein n=1 Tax=Alexandrium monilatum TaxID=311494 RepID=A0A7S4Q9M4_9DINO